MGPLGVGRFAIRNEKRQLQPGLQPALRAREFHREIGGEFEIAAGAARGVLREVEDPRGGVAQRREEISDVADGK